MATTKYTICLLKDSVTSFEDAVTSSKSLTRYDLCASIGFEASLFLGTQNYSTPDWISLINPYLDTPIGNAVSANISAVLLAKYEERIFAFCFGFGKSLLAVSSWVRDFGLKVTLNRVGHDMIRSIDTKVHEDMVLSARKQTSRASAIDSFDIDIGRSLVRGVTGKPHDTTFFKNLSGSDSLTLTTELPFSDIGDLLDELLVAYNDIVYQTHFKWIDNVREVDVIVAGQLDDLLLNSVINGTHEGLHLAPADIVDWDNIRGFNFTGGGRTIVYPELSFDNYLTVIAGDLPTLTLQQLQRHRVRVKYEHADHFQDIWSLYDCIVWETDFHAGRFVLFDGKWFEIDPTYATEVTRYVNTISRDAVSLPDAHLGDIEDVYNDAVITSNPNMFVLFHKARIVAEGATTPFEFCDILSGNGQFIHVKKRSASATLSHLFSQGSVSASTFIRDLKLREQVVEYLKEKNKLAHVKLIPIITKPNAANYEVVYTILAKNTSPWPPPLPFFSSVNLMHHGRLIESMGFKVSLQYVKQL